MARLQPIQIFIPQPCHEDWDKMTPTEQGRFCNTCQKCVVDFTGFTDKQLRQYILAHKEQQICGRFNNTQMNRSIQIHHQPQSRLYGYFIALGLTIVLTNAPITDIKARAPYVQTSILSDAFTQEGDSKKDSITIQGRVLDDYKEPVIGAFVEISNAGVKLFTAVTDEEGYYKAVSNNEIAQSEISLRVVFPGFKPQIIRLNKWNLQKLTIIHLEIDPSMFNTGVITIEYRVPLLDPFNPSNRTFTSDEIEKMPR